MEEQVCLYKFANASDNRNHDLHNSVKLHVCEWLQKNHSQILYFFSKYLLHLCCKLLNYMFSSHRHLKRRTPAGGIDRREYIGHLVDEYYTSTNVGKRLCREKLTVVRYLKIFCLFFRGSRASYCQLSELCLRSHQLAAPTRGRCIGRVCCINRKSKSEYTTACSSRIV